MKTLVINNNINGPKSKILRKCNKIIFYLLKIKSEIINK